MCKCQYCYPLPYATIVRGRLCKKIKKVSFDFAIALCSIGAPAIPKNFARRSEIENMSF